MNARLPDSEALALLKDEDFLTLGRKADAMRARLHPEGVVAFVIDRNINYTNVCTCQCRFCAFYRKPGDPAGYVLSTDEILRKIGELTEHGGTSVLMQGGLNPDLRLAWFEDLFRAIKKRFPDITLHSLSPSEVAYLADLEGLTVRETLLRLKEAGLDSLPGGGAEVLVDGVRDAISPRKLKSSGWLGVMEEAAGLGMRGTATMMFGAGETDEEIILHLARVRELQDRTGVFRAFIPWTFQPLNTELAGEKGIKPASAIRYLRVLAVSRLYLDNVENVQASWVTQGDKVAQLALRFGANDMGSTMLEENVVRAAGVSFRIGIDRLVEIIRDAGFLPARRHADYKIIQTFPGKDERAMTERRRDPRYSVTDLKLELKDGLSAKSINISSRGLYCTVDKRIPEFSKLKVSIDLPFSDGDVYKVTCDGVVVRCHPVKEGAHKAWSTAIYFLNLESDKAALIEDFLETVAK